MNVGASQHHQNLWYLRIYLECRIYITQTHLVLKYFPGDTLAKVCRRKGPLSETEARYFLRTIAKTLCYCHEQGVAHRDVKAENVLVGKDNRIKLIDFAFATKIDPGKKVDTYCGTPSYMAPEIFSKNPHCPKKADVWALGILAYRLVAGELPFVCKLR